MTVYAFPPAGTGASFYRGLSTTDVKLVGLDLAGRESRFTERAMNDLEEVVADAVGLLEARIDADQPLNLFGHSFGAAIAWRSFDRLWKLGRLHPDSRLCISSCPSPSSPRLQLSHLDDTSLVQEIERITGYSSEAYAIPELRQMLLPALRADLTSLQQLRPPTEAGSYRLCTIVSNADPLVRPHEMQPWQETTTEPLSSYVVRGGHMYMLEHPSSFQRLLPLAMTSAIPASLPVPA